MRSERPVWTLLFAIKARILRYLRRLPETSKRTPFWSPSFCHARSAKRGNYGSARIFVTSRGPKVVFPKLSKIEVGSGAFLRGLAGATLAGPKNDKRHQYLRHLAHFGGPEGQHRYVLERSVLGPFLAPPERQRSLVNYNVGSTFSPDFLDPVRDQIRRRFCRFPKNARSRKARYLRHLSYLLATYHGRSVEGKKHPFGPPLAQPKNGHFSFGGSQMRQIAFGSHAS